ncbi:DUF6328 family protein [Caballeronia sp. BCC1704]|uniref:DUF6328 family protein n=1 Tax=Caballeronia sp. BCC1704 TaxID=2676300 RepID=UPI00158E8718|nr:DUF6328 family protein [Caballeronia sp. BCC1704]
MDAKKPDSGNEDTWDDGDLSDLLNELRILLPAAQLLTAFLITLPFSGGFAKIVSAEKWVFLATFCCSLMSLFLFAAPAVQHRILRPLIDRPEFKRLASQQLLFGAIFLSFALVLSSNLVVSEVFGHLMGICFAIAAASAILGLWAVLPYKYLHRLSAKTSLSKFGDR